MLYQNIANICCNDLGLFEVVEENVRVLGFNNF